MTDPDALPPISRGTYNMLVQTVGDLQQQVAELRGGQVSYVTVPVTAVDAVAKTFTVTLTDQWGNTETLAGIPSASAPGHFLPAVGDSVRLSLLGAQVQYLPQRIAADAVGSVEIAPDAVGSTEIAAGAVGNTEIADGAVNWAELHGTVVTDINVILTTANGKNKVTYSTSVASGSGTAAGDIWFQRRGGVTGIALDATRLTPTAWTAPASSITVSPTYPTGVVAGDQVYAILVIKPDTATVATPTGWTLVGTSALLGAGIVGIDTGPIKIHVYKRLAAGALSGTQAFTVTSGSALAGHMRAFRPPATTTNVVWSETLASFSRTTTAADIDGTVTTTIASAAKDEFVIVTGTPTDAATNIIISALAGAGLTFEPAVQKPAGTVISGQGNDLSAAAAESKVTAGSATVAPVLSGGLNVAATGGSLLMRVRAVGDWPSQTQIIASWEWDGTAWQPRNFADEILATLSAAKITTGTLDVATQVNIGDPAGEHTELGGLGLAYYAPGGAGGTDLLQVARWGKTLGGINTVTGQQSYAVDNAGNASFTGLNITNDPVIQGQLLSYWLAQGDSRVVARTDQWANPGATTTELGMIELSCVTKPGHLYRIDAHGMLPDVAGADAQTIRFYARYTTTGSAPTITSTILATDDVLARFDAFPWENMLAHIVGYYAEGTTSHTLRVGLSYGNSTGSTSVGLNTDATLAKRYFMITDTGLDPGNTGQVNNMGGTISGGTPVTPPANPKVVGENLFAATWGKAWTGDGSVFVEGSNGVQGQSTYAPNGNMRTFLGFDTTGIQAALAGAEILYVKVYTYWNHWYWSDGGNPCLGVHSNTTAPAGPTGQFALSAIGPQVARSGALWYTLPDTWWANFANGTYKGICLGPAPDSSFNYYGKFNGPGATNGPVLAVGWRK